MPRLLIFCPAKSVLTDQRTSAIAILEILQGISGVVPPGGAIQVRNLIPFDNALFSLWFADEGEIGGTFEIKIDLVLADGSSIDVGTDEFSMAVAFHRHTFYNQAIVIGPVGWQWFRVSLRRKDEQETKWEIKGEFPMRVLYETQEALTASPLAPAAT